MEMLFYNESGSKTLANLREKLVNCRVSTLGRNMWRERSWKRRESPKSNCTLLSNIIISFTSCFVMKVLM